MNISSLTELEQQQPTANEVFITMGTDWLISEIPGVIWVIDELSAAYPGWTFTQYHLLGHVNQFAEALNELVDDVVPTLCAYPESEDLQIKAMERAQGLKNMAKGLRRFGLNKVCNKLANKLHRIVQRGRGGSNKTPANYLVKSLKDFGMLVDVALHLPVHL